METKKILQTLILVLGILTLVSAQTTTAQTKAVPVWTEADRKFLLDNLIRSKQEFLDETKNLTKEQWNFKENPNRWSINQIVEHIAIWELLFTSHVSTALARDPFPGFSDYPPDSVFFGGAQKNLNALDYTKPFSFAIPLGNNEGKNNITWLMTMRNESIEYLTKETRNIRVQYDGDMVDVHQIYIMVFNHTDKHLKQIRKVKKDPNYPKSVKG